MFNFLKLENEKKNMVYSPLSIKTALAMLSEGAEGNTKKQIKDAVGDDVVNNYGNIKDKVSFANAMYIRDTYTNRIQKSFSNKLKEDYYADVKVDSFKDALNINKWIEDKTFGRLKNVVTDSGVTNSEMILINALAIDMEWKNKFDDVYCKDFYSDASNSKDIAMMSLNNSKSDDIKYLVTDNVQVASFDLKKYGDNELEFIAIMPSQNLDEYVKGFNYSDIEKTLLDLRTTKSSRNGVSIYIPKFKFEKELNFVEDLKKLGIKDAFEPDKADFSGITGNKELYVGDAIHKAEIEFCEEGVKASAATVITAKATASFNQSEPEKITFDHPFMYLIKDKNTNDIWFVGTVYEPTTWEENKNNTNNTNKNIINE